MMKSFLLSRRRSGLGLFFTCALLTALGMLPGCSSNPTEEGKQDPAAIQPDASQVVTKDPAKTEKEPVQPAQPDPAELWRKQVAQVEELLKEDKLTEAEAALQGFRGIYPPQGTLAEETAKLESEVAKTDPSKSPAKLPPAGPSQAQKDELSALIHRLTSRRGELAAEERETLLASAQEAFQKQDYNGATTAINELLAISPTDEEKQAATSMRVEIERILARQRELRTFVRMLGSEDQNNVSAGQKRLGEEPEVALSLLLEAVQEKDNVILVRNSLELMRRMKRPDVSLPAMVGVLARPEQKASWDDAVREISRMNEPGAGEPLLELVVSSKDPEQRAAALESLVQVVDPPAETQVALLPLVMKDGPELPQALRALQRTVRVHGTYDAAAARNLDVSLTNEQAAQLEQLPARLEEIIAQAPEKPEKDDPQAAAAYEAQVLAMATHRQEPQVLPVVKVFSFSKEVDDGLAAAALDGVWNSVEYATQWRQPISSELDRCTLELDLGQTRTIMGVRIWNFNEPNGTHRGWREANVFVSDQPRALEPVATGIVPMAPGVGETPEAPLPDYSIFIPVDFVRGQYVKIQSKSFWRVDGYAGIAEVQVIGF